MKFLAIITIIIIIIITTKLRHEKIFFMITIWQLFLFAMINYFLFVSVDLLRWPIQLLLYFFALHIIFSKRVILDKITVLFSILFIINIISFLINSNNLIDFIKQVRLTFVGAAVYIFLMYGNFSKFFFDRTIKILLIIGYIQLPLIILQLLLFNKLAPFYNTNIYYGDYAAGSIGFRTSGITGTYLVMMSIIVIQECFTYSLNRRRIIQLIILLTPIVLINSDVQYFFIPLLLLFLFFVNKKISIKNFVLLPITFGVLIGLYNTFFPLITTGEKDFFEYITYLRTNKIWIRDVSKIDVSKGRLLRAASIRYVINDDVQNPSISILIGKGPGYWWMKDSEGGLSSITNVWYSSNVLLLSYAETGIFSVLILLLILKTLYSQTNESHWGKIVKILCLYILLVNFYGFPFSHLSLVIPIMIIIVYYRRYDRYKLNNQNKY